MPVGVIWSAWRGHKISDDDVSKELIRSRDRGAVSALQDVEVLIKRARHKDWDFEHFHSDNGNILIPGSEKSRKLLDLYTRFLNYGLSVIWAASSPNIRAYSIVLIARWKSRFTNPDL